jgi:hypothetical protein
VRRDRDRGGPKAIAFTDVMLLIRDGRRTGRCLSIGSAPVGWDQRPCIPLASQAHAGGMTDIHTAWSEVGDRLSSLGLKLQLHAEEELSDDEVGDRSALVRLLAAIDEATDAVTDAFHDEAVRTDAADLARAFAEAIEATARGVCDRVTNPSDRR